MVSNVSSSNHWVVINTPKTLFFLQVVLHSVFPSRDFFFPKKRKSEREKNLYKKMFKIKKGNLKPCRVDMGSRPSITRVETAAVSRVKCKARSDPVMTSSAQHYNHPQLLKNEIKVAFSKFFQLFLGRGIYYTHNQPTAITSYMRADLTCCIYK